MMQLHTVEPWRHSHQYEAHAAGSERNTRWVVILTVTMMVVEIGAGSYYGSLALLADGWHMGTHAAALSITLIAYYFARRLANDSRFSFGTGKMGVLAGYSSAVVLLLVALLMAFEAVQRLITPHFIQYNEAILVASVGLSVNLFSAYLLRGHQHAGDHHHHGQGHDHNLKAAYLHVLADALTSVLAIAALLAGKMLGWSWMDAIMGIVGALVITRWSVGLLRDTGGILLDRAADEHILQEIRQCLQAEPGTHLVDLHVWKINSNQYAGALTIAAQSPQPVEYYRTQLLAVHELAHVTIEVHAS